MERIFSEEEYNAIDYVLGDKKLYDSGFYIQQNNNEDYFVDEENNEELSIEEGLEIINDTFCGNEDYYSTETKNGLKSAFKRFLDIDLEI